MHEAAAPTFGTEGRGFPTTEFEILALSRKKKQAIVVTTKSGEIIVIHFADACRVGIDAPETVKIMRAELNEEGADGTARKAG